MLGELSSLLTAHYPLIIILLFTGLVAGFVGGLFGIGGGIIVVPALFLVFGATGIADDIRLQLAIGTSLSVIIVTATRSLWAHYRHGQVDVKLLMRWLPWVALGSLLAGFIAALLPKKILSLIFAFGAFYIGQSRLRAAKGVPKSKDALKAGEAEQNSHSSTIKEDNEHWSVRFVPGIGMALGLFSSLLGVGGGAAAILIMGWAGRPIHQAVATASGFGLGVAIPGAISFALAGYNLDSLPPGSFGLVSLPAFFALASMTMITAPIGAKMAHKLPASLLSRLFGAYVILVALGMFYEGFFR